MKDENNKESKEKKQCNCDSGKYLRDAMKEYKVDMEDLCKKLGRSEGNVNRILCGIQGLDVEKLRILAENFGISPNEIVLGPDYDSLMKSYKRKAGISDESNIDYFDNNLNDLRIELKNQDFTRQARIIVKYLQMFVDGFISEWKD